jgi:hypothetical protein
MILMKVFKMKRKAANSLVFLVILVAMGGIGYTALRAQDPQPTEPPDDLVNLPAIPGAGPIAVYQDLARSWYAWDTIQKELTIKRRERQTISSSWYEQIQELTTSYYIVDVRSVCSTGGRISGLFLAGLYPNGDACIERWAFTYPIYPIPVGGGYVPINDRPLPTVRRVELYRGSAYGRISCLEPDPESRFVLFLTRESHTLYRKSLSTGIITVELAPASQPLLAQIHRIVARHHATQGRKFVLSTTPRWGTTPTGSTDVLVMSDSNNDGAFESTAQLTVQAWVSAGYANNPAAWTSLCP